MSSGGPTRAKKLTRVALDFGPVAMHDGVQVAQWVDGEFCLWTGSGAVYL